MIDSDEAGGSRIVKMDALGRARTTKEQREAILDAFDQSGLSGPDFARLHEINYQTFATWRQKRRRERGEYPEAPESSQSPQKPLESFTLVEAMVETPGSSETLILELGKDARLIISEPSQVPLVVTLLKHWEVGSSC